MYNSSNKILSKFVKELIKYRIMFKDNASLITFYFVIIEIRIKNSDQSDYFIT